jgi:excisionase family DNA binding protein
VETQLQSEDITLISIYKELTQLKLLLTEFALFSGKRTFNNKTLSEYLGVSTRTLQHWRDEGKISFTQIKDVILYKEDDVELFMKKHRRTSFK